MGEGAELFVVAILFLEPLLAEFAFVTAGVVQLFDLVMGKTALLAFFAVTAKFAFNMRVCTEIRASSILGIVVVETNLFVMRI